MNHVTGPSRLLDPHYPMDDICSVRAATLPRRPRLYRTEMPASRNGGLTSHTMGYKMSTSRAAARKQRQQQPEQEFHTLPCFAQHLGSGCLAILLTPGWRFP